MTFALVAPQEARLYSYVAIDHQRLQYRFQRGQCVNFRAISHANIKLGEGEAGDSKRPRAHSSGRRAPSVRRLDNR